MMKQADIVERLRDWVSRPDNSRLQLHALSLEAADEIERLRAAMNVSFAVAYNHALEEAAKVADKQGPWPGNHIATAIRALKEEAL